MLRRIGLAAFTLSAMTTVATPAAAASINLRGVVPTICEMRYELSDQAPVTTAELVIFCNAPEGARVSAILLGGEDNGYQVTHAGGSFLATPGMEFDIRTYGTAFWGRELIQISQLSGQSGPPATIVFQIVPEG